MRIWIFGFCMLIVAQLPAQVVTTVAGVLDSVGAVNGPVDIATFNSPHGIATDSFGNVYVADRYNHMIRRITPDGVVETWAGNGQPGDVDGNGEIASFFEPWGLCSDQLGNLYVADTKNNKIRRVDTDRNVTTVAGTGNFGTTDGIAQFATFGNPTGIEIGLDGSIYVADHLTHIIRKISTTNQVSTIAGSPFTPGDSEGFGNAAQFYRPYGLEVDNEGNIIVADEWNHKIKKVTPAGEVTTVAGSGILGSQDGAPEASSFNFPWDMTVDVYGNIFVMDGFNYVVRKIPVSQDGYGEVSTFVGSAGNTGAEDGVGELATFSGATAIDYMHTTREFYVGDAFNNLIRKIVDLEQQTVSIQVLGDSGTEFCEGGELSIRAVPEVYDVYEFYIENTLVQSSSSNIYQTSNLAAGLYNVSVIARFDTEVLNSEPVPITVNPNPVADISIVGNTTFFQGDSVIFIASQGDSYLWSTGETTPTITVMETGSYSVTVTSDEGCSGVSSAVEVLVQQFSAAPEIALIQGEAKLCPGRTAVLQSSYAQNNQWLFDGFPIQGETDSTLVVTATGSYQVQVLDSLGFTLTSDPMDIEIVPDLVFDITANPTTVEDLTTEVLFTADVNEDYTLNYFWDFGEPDSGTDNFSNAETPGHFYLDAGAYTIQLIVSEPSGCTDTLAKVNYVNVILDGSGNGNPDDPDDPNDPGDPGNPSNPGAPSEAVFIPNAFTPNGDGLNDVFYVRGTDIDEIDFMVFNQWGEMVFQTVDPAVGWDGMANGQMAACGTYVYAVQVVRTNGTTEQISGTITVIR
ncbi:MAG: gliding motility-associated C-terminal domain-containing protein [Bacteroidota bacterium]